MRTALYYFVLGSGAGILIETFFDGGIALIFFVLLIMSAGAVFYLLSKRHHTKVCIALMLTVCIGVSVGVVRMYVAESRQQPHALDALLGMNTLEGVVVAERDVRENTARLTVKLDDAYGKQKILVITDRYTDAVYGDRVIITGSLQRPESFADSDGRIFNYGAYLAKDTIHYVVAFADVAVQDSGLENGITAALLSIKRSYVKHLELAIPEPAAALAGGITVGTKRSLGEELTEKFRATGIIHIVVLSGYNVSLIADFMMRVLSRLPQAVGTSFGALGIVLFAIMTGATATTVRASIMALLVVFARSLGRAHQATRLLFIAGFVMVMWNPYLLAYDVSFQLSFVATLGLIVFSPWVEKWLWFVSPRFLLRELIAATIATQIFVLPLILYYMGDFSVVSVAVNALVLPVVAPAMLVTFLVGVVGFIGVPLSLPFGWGSYALLSYILLVVDVFARLPFAVLHIGAFSFWWVIIAYGVYGIIAWGVYTKE